VGIDPAQIGGHENLGHGPGVIGGDIQADKEIPAEVRERFGRDNFKLGIHGYPFRRGFSSPCL
jgi:hypothetical protein